MQKDGFLILGFTGPFCSGCTTAAKFFGADIINSLSKLVDDKKIVNIKISDAYKENPVADTKKKLLKLFRNRLLINSASTIDPVPFIYISLTDILISFIIRDILNEKASNKKYHEIISKIKTCLSKNKINKRYIKKLESALDKKEENGFTSILEFQDKIIRIKKAIFENYKSDLHIFVEFLQSAGNNLRRCGNTLDDSATFTTNEFLPSLAHRANKIIKIIRAWVKDNTPWDKRTYFAIECFRNPEEIEYFRKRYYEFYLFSIFAHEKVREERAIHKLEYTAKNFSDVDLQDQGDSDTAQIYSQNIKRCVNLADICIVNCDKEKPKEVNIENMYNKLLRYFILIQRPGCLRPTHMESNMNFAYSLSLNSTCISRQVGAVIVKNKVLISAGWNDTDINKVGCMYRQIIDLKNTTNESIPLSSDEKYRDFKSNIIKRHKDNHSFCYKDEYGIFFKDSKKSLQQCRALHAEEMAILHARNAAGVDLTGCTVYTTTFPCELCMKKIQHLQAAKIIYCEPYPKSVSEDVFLKESLAIIRTIPFEGVKSPSFYKLFKPTRDLKDIQE